MTFQTTRSEQQKRAEKFAADRGFALERFLGFGNDGAVWESSHRSVVKIEEREESFVRELNCYLRLTEKRIIEIHGFTVPQLLDHDCDLMAIEMSFVFPPCILDFAKSYIDLPITIMICGRVIDGRNEMTTIIRARCHGRSDRF